MDRLPATPLAASTAPPAPGFDALVAQGLQLLPAYAPEWTDHNASDPGITLVEALAFFAEALLYRVGRVSLAGRVEFLRLLRGDGGGGDGAELEALRRQGAGAVRDALDRAVDALSQLDCAVTPLDHERLARTAIADLPHGAQTRVRCVADTDLDRAATLAMSGQPFAAGSDRGHLSLVVMPPPDCPPEAEDALVDAVDRFLEPRRLLTSRVHVLPPVRLYLGVRVRATPRPGVELTALAARLARTLGDWHPPLAEDAGDHTLALSEIADRAALVEGVEGVEGVARTRTPRYRRTGGSTWTRLVSSLRGAR